MALDLRGAMGIDSFTLVIASGAVICVLGLLFVYMRRQDRQAPWFTWLAGAYLLATPAAWLMAQRDSIPNIASMGGGTALLLLCFGCLWTASRVFGGRRVLWLPLLAVPVLWVSSFIIPGFDAVVLLGVRVVIASVPAAGFFFLGAWELWRGRDELLPSRTGAIAFHITGGVFFTFRIVAVALLPFPLGGQEVHPVATAIFNLVTFVHALFLSVLMISLTKERHENEQRMLAESDALTGLPNRRAFATEAERLMRRQKHNRAPLALIILDLDHFKAINDKFGHDAGDKVLIEFGAVMSRALRPGDFRFRMGGEEFCCLLPDLTIREAQAVADRICDAFQASTVDVLGGKVRCTVSIGIASSDICGYVLEDLLNEADAATYEAKASGRNRAVLAIAKPNAPVVPTIDNVTDIRGKLRA
ncbi:GGDEF domain-containing protein [uncultured Devosia sp.]|uniref:GGDEF domain-containing protein n=1 Tax=uncultured Devosia sp. TaxID=211434 RepID=UPI0035C9B860